MRKIALSICALILTVIIAATFSACNNETVEFDFNDETYGYLLNSDGENTVTLAHLSNKQLKDAVIPALVVYEGKTYTITQIGEAAFAPKPDGVTLKEAFNYDSSLDEKNEYLETVTFAEGSQVTTIGGRAFEKCKSLKSIVFPQTLETIKGFAFNKCALVSITIPKSVKLIDNYAFCNNLELKTVTLQSSDIASLPKVGAAAFKWFDKSKVQMFGGEDVYPLIDNLKINVASNEVLNAFKSLSSSTTMEYRNWSDYTAVMSVIGG